jgi:hypothetical protein
MNEARVCVRVVDAVLFDRKPRAAVGLRWMAHDHRTEFRPRREETFLTQAQVAAWSAGRAEREQAGFRLGPHGGLARGARSEGERAVGHFLFSGRIS